MYDFSDSLYSQSKARPRGYTLQRWIQILAQLLSGLCDPAKSLHLSGPHWPVNCGCGVNNRYEVPAIDAVVEGHQDRF